MTVDEIARLVKQVAKRTDNIFQKETQYANNKCDENDENLVAVELNEDQNEMTHNLNYTLNNYFTEISIIKIMDNIFSDGNKDKAEKMKMKQKR